MGKIRAPYYRVVVADSRTKRDGRVIETIGKYHPKEEPSLIDIDSDRALYWLSVGAQPSEPVAALLRKTGDWQKFKGEPAPEPLKMAPERVNRKAVFEDAAREAATISENDRNARSRGGRGRREETGGSTGASTGGSPAAAPAATSEAAPADTPAADTAPADTAPADTAPPADTAAVDTAAVDTAAVDTAAVDTAPAQATVAETTEASE
jgi:small subunit ribosomal protein S16